MGSLSAVVLTSKAMISPEIIDLLLSLISVHGTSWMGEASFYVLRGMTHRED